MSIFADPGLFSDRQTYGEFTIGWNGWKKYVEKRGRNRHLFTGQWIAEKADARYFMTTKYEQEDSWENPKDISDKETAKSEALNKLLRKLDESI